MALLKPLVYNPSVGVQVLQSGDSLDAVSQEVDVISVTNGEASVALVKGTPVYFFGANQVRRSQANAAATAPVQGFITTTSAAAGAAATLQSDGFLSATTAEWDAVKETGTGGLTAGQRYYLSTSAAGKITPTPPSTGYYAPVGVAMSTTVLQIMKSVPIQIS